MLPYARSICSLLFGLLASGADGKPADAKAPLAASVRTADDLHIDRRPNLVASGPFMAYAVEFSLESEACSGFDKRRQLRGRIGSAVIHAAAEQLNLPMGTGRFLSVQGRKYLFCLEPHYREPGTGRGPTGWHKGVTVYDAS